MDENTFLNVMDVLLNTPFLAVLLYLLVAERKEHSATRLKLLEEQHHFAESYAKLAERVVIAVDRLDLPGPM